MFLCIGTVYTTARIRRKTHDTTILYYLRIVQLYESVKTEETVKAKRRRVVTDDRKQKNI